MGALEGSSGVGGGLGAAVTFGCRRGPAVKVTRDTRGLAEASRERARPGLSTRGAASRGRPRARRLVNGVNESLGVAYGAGGRRVLPFPSEPGPGGTRSAAWPGPGGHRGGRAPCPLWPGTGLHLFRAFQGFGETPSAFAERSRVAAINFTPSFVPKRARSEGPGGGPEGAGGRWAVSARQDSALRVLLGGFVRLMGEEVLVGSPTNTPPCAPCLGTS